MTPIWSVAIATQSEKEQIFFCMLLLDIVACTEISRELNSYPLSPIQQSLPEPVFMDANSCSKTNKSFSCHKFCSEYERLAGLTAPNLKAASKKPTVLLNGRFFTCSLLFQIAVLQFIVFRRLEHC